MYARSQITATEVLDEGPPARERLKRFFVGHQGRVFLLGAAAVLAGLAVAGLNFFSCGITLPFTLPLTYALISFGVGAISVSCATIFMGGEGGQNNGGTSAPHDGTLKKKIKARGQRASSAYLTRQIRPRPVPVAAPYKKNLQQPT